MAPRSTKLRSVPEGPAVPKVEPASKVRLTADRVLVRMPDESERKSKAGLLIPATAVMGPVLVGEGKASKDEFERPGGFLHALPVEEGNS